MVVVKITPTSHRAFLRPTKGTGEGLLAALAWRGEEREGEGARKSPL
jgi:hypothetical protein